MICGNCHKENKEGSTFCSYCGNKLDVQMNAYNQNAVNNTTVINNNSHTKNSYFSKGQWITICSLLLVVIVVGFFALMSSGIGKKRTIMMYIVGSNLEYESGIVTADLAAIDPNKIDLNKTNVILYTGGTKSWKNNYISNEENAIFELTKTGFKKVKTFDKRNMGDPETLSTFINYAVSNYKASHYNLVLYDHGGALDGAIYDDFTSDNLSLSDLRKAMDATPFKDSKKLDAVLFRTCLNGTLEVAKLFEPYSRYIVFSEEVSYGSSWSNVLSFINEVKLEDTGAEFGSKFLKSYSAQMNYIDGENTLGYTYSVVDLSKINNVVSELGKFIKGIDISINYDQISKARSQAYQYGVDSANYDTVDLYSFASSLSKYSKVSVEPLLKAINEAVVDNYSNLDDSKGLSIYFPYNGKNARIKYLDVYKGLDFSSDYSAFINNFYSAQTGAQSNKFSFAKSEMIENSDKEISIQLTPEQQSKYSSSKYILWKRNKDHPNYYQPIYISNDAILSEDGKLTTQIKNNLLIVETEEGKNPINLVHTKSGSLDTYTSGAILYDRAREALDKAWSRSATLYFSYDKDTAKVSVAKVSYDADERVEGTLLDLKRYTYMEMYLFIYKILDAKGNFTLDFESSPEYRGFGDDLDKVEFKRGTVSDVDGELYLVFVIYDTNGERYTSNLMKVGK